MATIPAGGIIRAMAETPNTDDWPVDVLRQDENGVDLSLIEHNLSLTPQERLEQYFQFMRFVEVMREAGRKHYGLDPRSLAKAD